MATSFCGSCRLSFYPLVVGLLLVVDSHVALEQNIGLQLLALYVTIASLLLQVVDTLNTLPDDTLQGRGSSLVDRRVVVEFHADHDETPIRPKGRRLGCVERSDNDVVERAHEGVQSNRAHGPDENASAAGPDITLRVGGHVHETGDVRDLPENSSRQQEANVVPSSDLVLIEGLLCAEVDGSDVALLSRADRRANLIHVDGVEPPLAQALVVDMYCLPREPSVVAVGGSVDEMMTAASEVSEVVLGLSGTHSRDGIHAAGRGRVGVGAPLHSKDLAVGRQEKTHTIAIGSRGDTASIGIGGAGPTTVDGHESVHISHDHSLMWEDVDEFADINQLLEWFGGPDTRGVVADGHELLQACQFIDQHERSSLVHKHSILDSVVGLVDRWHDSPRAFRHCLFAGHLISQADELMLLQDDLGVDALDLVVGSWEKELGTSLHPLNRGQDVLDDRILKRIQELSVSTRLPMERIELS
mmetsp:Transcript_14543/g.32127  ORF Transcript_14543/g.32127 Transcript_14543/m.32127 type:complete len:472 (+) Transcript_14543:233-1648(+)